VTPAACALVLHCHIPYVLNHGRWPHGSEWLYEAVAETYLPLIAVLRRLQADGLQPRLTISVSPVLAEQLASGQFRSEFPSFIAQKVEAARADKRAFASAKQMQLERQAGDWIDWWTATERLFAQVDGDLIGAWRQLAADGVLEILTCGVTHGYYPLLSRDESLEVQTRLAVATHRRLFGTAPSGFWLPECAYRPAYSWPPPVAIDGVQARYPRRGVEAFLDRHGLDFFIVDSPLLTGGMPTTVYGNRFEHLRSRFDQFSEHFRPEPAAPGRSPHQVHRLEAATDRPVYFVTPATETGVLVWSGEYGYPGDPAYLEFHKKHSPGGLRYWAVTSVKSDLADKQLYDQGHAFARTEIHAKHFVERIREQVSRRDSDSGHRPILVAPYDAELFGHWWFEGLAFLEHTLRRLALSQSLDTVHLADYLAGVEAPDSVALPEGSWGLGSNHSVWLNEQTAWSWEQIYACEADMVGLAGRLADYSGEQRPMIERVLRQAARELLLLSASDWQFLIANGSAVEYATARLSGHAEDFRSLADLARVLLDGGQPLPDQLSRLEGLEARDGLFADLEPAWFAELPPVVSA